MMKLSSTSRFVAACLTLFSLLFMQLAVAAYACPAMPQNAIASLSGVSANPLCHQVDQDQPTLCRVHASDTANKSSLDKPDVPDVPAFIPVQMAQTIAIQHIAMATRNWPVRSRTLPSHAPPATILHCCFQI